MGLWWCDVTNRDPPSEEWGGEKEKVSFYLKSASHVSELFEMMHEVDTNTELD